MNENEDYILMQIRDYARAHYEDGGWDVIEECWSDDRLREEIRKRKTYNATMKFLRRLVSIWADQQADARNSAF